MDNPYRTLSGERLTVDTQKTARGPWLRRFLRWWPMGILLTIAFVNIALKHYGIAFHAVVVMLNFLALSPSFWKIKSSAYEDVSTDVKKRSD